jgi:hypothetical protein
MMMMIRKT